MHRGSKNDINLVWMDRDPYLLEGTHGYHVWVNQFQTCSLCLSLVCTIVNFNYENDGFSICPCCTAIVMLLMAQVHSLLYILEFVRALPWPALGLQLYRDFLQLHKTVVFIVWLNSLMQSDDIDGVISWGGWWWEWKVFFVFDHSSSNLSSLVSSFDLQHFNFN